MQQGTYLKWLALVLPVLGGCTVVVNMGPQPQSYSQPAVVPTSYQEPVRRQPHSIKAVQNRRLTEQEGRLPVFYPIGQAGPTQPLQQVEYPTDGVDYATRERARQTPGQFSPKQVDQKQF